MNIIVIKHKWKFSLFIIAILIALGSLWYTTNLIGKVSGEERKKIELWAEAVRELEEINVDGQISLIVYRIIGENTTIPVILVDNDNQIVTSENLDSIKIKEPNYLEEQLKQMKAQHDPVVLTLADGKHSYIYYKDSDLLTQLVFYPLFQTTVILLFILVSYFAFNSSRKSEQDRMWVGMSKETAHQLGTPISSLLAWVELLKMRNEDPKMVVEVEKDVKRLETITNRFSKIGSSPSLQKENLVETLIHATNYLQTRTSQKVIYNQAFSAGSLIKIPINTPLFEWVIENLWKNAVDAMGGNGTIKISIIETSQMVHIDFSDTGKGIPKSRFKAVFKPGFTTKKRGWGLGLSLTKRIIDFYHKGRIYVKSSEINKGTTFRISLNKEMD